MLTGLELTFMGVTRSKSVPFSTPGFVVSPVGKRERGGKRKKNTHTHTKQTKTKMGRREKVNRKGKEGRESE